MSSVEVHRPICDMAGGTWVAKDKRWTEIFTWSRCLLVWLSNVLYSTVLHEKKCSCSVL